MRQHHDQAIILSRIDYGERDRILTLLCKETGKVSVLAKSVRSEKSRLAGGIELLSESDIGYIDGKSNLKTLTAARLRVHFGNISQDMRCMQQAFSHIKAVHGIIEDGTGQEYYQPLLVALAALNNLSRDPRLIDIWFSLQVLQLSGSAPNLRVDATDSNERFNFDYDLQQFVPFSAGQYTQNDLKLLRLCYVQPKPPVIQQELGSEDKLQALVNGLLKTGVTEL